MLIIQRIKRFLVFVRTACIPLSRAKLKEGWETAEYLEDMVNSCLTGDLSCEIVADRFLWLLNGVTSVGGTLVAINALDNPRAQSTPSNMRHILEESLEE